jgi:hypothetical protein
MCKEKDLYEPSGKNPDDTEELDLSFKFSLRTDKQIGVMATSANEKVAEGILIGIYPQQPYEEDGTIVLSLFMLVIQMWMDAFMLLYLFR